MSAAAGAGQGVLQGIADATKPNPWITPPPEAPSIRDQYIQNALQPPPPMELGQQDYYGGMAYGGTIPYGGEAQVGDEQVYVDDTGAHVTPNPNETPEERAKKQVYIVRQSSLSNAISMLASNSVVLKKGFTTQDAIETARQFEAYVFGNDPIKGLMEMEDDVPL